MSNLGFLPPSYAVFYKDTFDPHPCMNGTSTMGFLTGYVEIRDVFHGFDEDRKKFLQRAKAELNDVPLKEEDVSKALNLYLMKMAWLYGTFISLLESRIFWLQILNGQAVFHCDFHNGNSMMPLFKKGSAEEDFLLYKQGQIVDIGGGNSDRQYTVSIHSLFIHL